jgi:phage shock protein B
MQILNFLVAPTVVFLAVVAPVWIIMHYRSTRQSSRSLTQGDLRQLEELLIDVDQMTRRIEALEAILEQDDVNWQRYTDQRDADEARETEQ